MNQRSMMRHCKFCQSTDIFRVARHGFLQKKVLNLFGRYPWECPHCRRISLLADRGRARGHYRASSRPRVEKPVAPTAAPVHRAATEN